MRKILTIILSLIAVIAIVLIFIFTKHVHFFSETTTTTGITEGEVTFSFNDMGEPGVKYGYTINIDTQEILMNIVYFDSTGEGPTEINKTVKVTDELIWEDLKNILNTNILATSDENIFGYKYHDALNMLCYTLEDIEYAQTDDILYEKGVDGGEYWDSIYGDYDINKDGKVTYREKFDNHVTLIISLLK